MCLYVTVTHMCLYGTVTHMCLYGTVTHMKMKNNMLLAVPLCVSFTDKCKLVSMSINPFLIN